MWKRNKDDYRALMENINNDANNITSQLDTIATPRVSALDGGQEQMSRNSFLEAKRNSTRHGSVGPSSEGSGGTFSKRSQGSTASMNPISLFTSATLPKELQLRGDAVQALNKVAQLLADKNTPPNLEMGLLDKGFQLIESLRASRERINRKHIKKGSYLTLMSALDKRDFQGGRGRVSRPRAGSTVDGDDGTVGNPWSRLIEQNYWWPHHIHSVMGRSHGGTFESREPSPVPTSKSLVMDDPLKYSAQFNQNVSMPADREGSMNNLSAMDSRANSFAPSPTNANPSDSFADIFLAVKDEPTTSDVSSLFYDESDLAMHALEMISDEEAKRPGMGVMLSGTKKHPSVVSEAYNQGLREHFIHAAHNKDHPMCACINAFLRYNASAILRISLPDSLNIQPAVESQVSMWDLKLGEGNSKGATPTSGGASSTFPTPPMPKAAQPSIGFDSPAMSPSTNNYLSVSGKLGPRGSQGMRLNRNSSPPTTHSGHTDPYNSLSLNNRASPTNAADDNTKIKCLWGIAPSEQYEKQFLRDRLQFIQSLCETVLDRMFSDKHIPVVVTSTHVDGLKSRSIDNLSPVRKGRAGRALAGHMSDGTYSEKGERNSADGSMASSVRPSTTATGANGSPTRRRTAIDLSFPFTEVLPEIIDSKLELLAVKSIFRWAEGFEANRRKELSEDAAEAERMKLGALTPGLIRDTSSRLLLEGAAAKLHDFLKAISDSINTKEMIFVDEMYERLMDSLMITYNIAETSRVRLAGTHAGADDVFPCIVHIVGSAKCAFLISALLRWTSTSTVACRLPPFLSKGVEAYVLQSFIAAANAVVGCIMQEGPGYGF